MTDGSVVVDDCQADDGEQNHAAEEGGPQEGMVIAMSAKAP